MIQLGDKVKDPITGCTGVAVSRTQWLYGCTRIGVQARKRKDGTIPEVEWFDEPQLAKVAPGKNKKPGGPMLAEPTRNPQEARRG